MFIVLLRPWYEMKMEFDAGSGQSDTRNPLWHSRNNPTPYIATSFAIVLGNIRSER